MYLRASLVGFLLLANVAPAFAQAADVDGGAADTADPDAGVSGAAGSDEAGEAEPPESTPLVLAPAPVLPAAPTAVRPVPSPAASPARATRAGAHAASMEASGVYGAVAVLPAASGDRELGAIPRNVQQLDRAALDDTHALGLADALNQRLGSVVLNDVQNNPLQPDLQYRGYTASPLLGSPQGLVVYQNAVRLNDAFGDVVQWDLVPEFAVHRAQMLPGASPLYGLNALGGGLQLQMKDGFRAPGARVDVLAGSFARHQASAEYGHSWNDWAVFGGVSTFGEQGFRDESQSSRRQLYADLRRRTDRDEVGFTATLVSSDLNGNGPAPIELLQHRRSAVFTYPDNTQNNLLLLAADAKHRLADHVSLDGTAYFKHLLRNTSNGDEAELAACSGRSTVLCDEGGEALVSETGAPIGATNPVYDGFFNTTRTLSDAFGGLVHVDVDAPLFGRPNRLVLGGAYDGSTVGFMQRAELGRLTDDRSVIGENLFVGNDAFRTKLGVDNHHLGAFVSEELSVVEHVWLQLSGRFDWSRVELSDRIGTALDGNHEFQRFNPAIGVTYQPIDVLTLFASYAESSRAPSASELACADPNQPCRVPNAFIADPALEQVVARSLELGARGYMGSRRRPALSWSLAGFGSRNENDILFVAGSHVGTGYFRNAGETQRVGVEAGLEARLGMVRVFASYALLRATFESPLTLPGEGNPRAREGDDGSDVIDVRPGDRIPGLPLHSLKSGVVVTPLPKWDLGVSSIAQSSRPFRGDEANLIGPVPGYAIFEAHTTYWLLDTLQLVLKAQNVLGARYETFGVLADPGDVVPGVANPRFLSPGAPFAVWAGAVFRESAL